MSDVPELAFSHMGMFVTDLGRMEEFYTRVLGFIVTDRGELGSASLVFLSRDPGEHHQIVLVSGRPAAQGFNALNQVSFSVADLAGLREMHRRLEREGVKELSPVSHGNALSVYFRDPEGNRLELFIDTPWYVGQPVRVPFDLTLPDDEIWAWAEADARKRPGFKPAEEWRAAVSEKLRRSR
jgi:catechol 2,3-dioxygenase-like lactoylglutathione lyase family enzyme